MSPSFLGPPGSSPELPQPSGSTNDEEKRDTISCDYPPSCLIVQDKEKERLASQMSPPISTVPPVRPGGFLQPSPKQPALAGRVQMETSI